MSKLHVVLSCTSRKRTNPPPHLRLSDLPQGADRVNVWIGRVEAATLDIRAEDLYAGEYWASGTTLRSRAREHFDVEAWVISAGVGLVSLSANVCAYGATLGTRHPDSVVDCVVGSPTTSQQRRRWWAALAGRRGPGRDGDPRTLASLASRDSDASFVVCAGPNYLDAVADDLVAAQGNLDSTGRLLVFGSGRPVSGLETSWIAAPGRLRTFLGGSMASSAVRAASEVIGEIGPEGPLEATRARQLIHRLVESSDPLPVHERKRLDDDEILGWVRAHVLGHGDTTKSVALRDFRGAGMACEQSRFGRLFEMAIAGPQ